MAANTLPYRWIISDLSALAVVVALVVGEIYAEDPVLMLEGSIPLDPSAFIFTSDEVQSWARQTDRYFLRSTASR